MLRIKQRSEDFRVRELLRDEVLVPRGEWRVYRVVKRKLTSMEAAERLAELAGVTPGEVTMAGLKDRQGVTVQHMALHKGREVSSKTDNLRIESIGFSEHELGAEASTGNAFDLVVRGLDGRVLETLRKNLQLVREEGVVNYFDDQRFGNLKHGQGWIALRLLRGEHEQALKDLLTAPSAWDDRRNSAFKSALVEAWGNWAACRDVAGRFRAHHSVFEHLKREPENFAGAFRHVATRLRLIHLFAFQSHLWNRAVAGWVRENVPVEQRVVVESLEGPLVFPACSVTPDPAMGGSFRLPGPRLEDVTHPEQHALLTDVLAAERLVPAAFAIDGVPGFQLKGEDRDLFVVPRHLRVRPAEPDTLNRGMRLVKVRFELPRGAYATLVVKRLLGVGVRDAVQGRAWSSAPVRAPRPEERRRSGGERGDRDTHGGRTGRPVRRQGDRRPRKDGRSKNR